MAKAETKEVVKASPAGVPAPTMDYGTDADGGFQNQTGADLSVPFVAVLQALSPQVVDDSPKGARPGMLINTVTEELYDGKAGIPFVPVMTEHVFVEWKPRESGGGFVGIHLPGAPEVAKAKQESEEFGKYKLPNGNVLTETFYQYCLHLGEDLEEMIGYFVLAYSSTKIGPYKKYNTRLNLFQVKTPDGRKQRPPMFAHRALLTTEKQSNNKGEFFNFHLEPAKEDVASSLIPPSHQLLEDARSFMEMVQKGLARAAYESQAAAGQDSEAGAQPGEDKDIPF